MKIALELKEMKTIDLQELKTDKLYCLNKAINMCKQYGNKNWKDNIVVKEYGNKIIEIDKILNERERKYGRAYLDM